MSEEQLITSRTTTKGSLTRLYNYALKFDSSNDDMQEIYARMPALEETYKKLNDIQEQLETFDLNKHEPSREAYEKKYFTTKAKMNKLVQEYEAENTSAITVNQNTTTTDNEDSRNRPNASFVPQVKLPEVHLPVFSGDYQEWQNFKELFAAVIDDNRHIAPIQKLYYLKGALKGEAQKIVQTIAPSAENYATAWQLLKERYDNVQFNANCHLKALFDLPAITRESVSGLRKLLTDTKQHLRSLEALKLPVKHWDTIIIYLLGNKLDLPTRREWELSKRDEKLPTLEEFYKFLEQRCLALEFVNQDKYKIVNKAVHAATVSTENKQRQCKICKENYHPLYQCQVFLKYDIENRIKAIKSTGVCFNCLRFGHSTFQCNAKSCRVCHRKHNSLIHQDKKDHDSATGASTNMSRKMDGSTEPPKEKCAEPNVSLHNAAETNQILLSTAKIKILDRNGFWKIQRAILDSASQLNFITKDAIKQLKLETNAGNVSINGVNMISAESNELVKLTIASNTNNFKRTLEFIVLENITCNLPAIPFEFSEWKIPQNIQIADPEFNEPGRIDILLGGEIFFDILEHGQLRLGKNLPVLQNTRLGWIIGGKIELGKCQASHNKKHTLLVVQESSLERALTSFWEIEHLRERKMTLEEKRCEEHFRQNVSRTKNGRYVVKMPLKTEKTTLGNSFQEASRRFKSLETRFTKDPNLKNQYAQFMKEYMTLGHMQQAEDDPDEEACYLPHHPVFKRGDRDKIRVVFDASMKTTSGKSLNDILMIGPVVQQELISIILRFRTHLIVFTADIKKMYRQISIHKDQLDLQRILWRNDQTEELKSYHLKTVTYGTAAAPYLATKCLNQLAVDEAHKYPVAASRVDKDFYVDDVMCGAATIEEGLILQRQMIELLEKGCFKLHKWCANNAKLLENINSEDLETHLPLSIGTNEVKTLGLLWLPADDTFKFVININSNMPDTKRKMLAEIAGIFDPLGVLGPILTIAKLTMQQLWKLHIGWDDPVPDQVKNEWNRWRKQATQMKSFQLPRCLFEDKPIKHIQIHGFCDASENAYGGVLYALTEYTDGSKSVKLICSKSRVAPIKPLTVPRLELSGALLLAKLIEKVIPSLDLKLSHIYLWTDSMIVLAWLASPPTRWQTFVANRTAANEGIHWRFIPPNSPHFGGSWEAGIKSVKSHIKRVVGNAHLNYEEMYTILTLIEPCLNSRPLIPISNDPTDFSILTPAHFLIGDVLTSIPEPDYTVQSTNKITKWQQIQQMHQHFWQRWSTEYLSHLQQRYKWHKTQPEHHEGMIVLLKEDHLPPLNWCLARITKVHPGADGHIRVVTLKTSNGKEYKRSITKICPLPIEDNEPPITGLKETLQGGRNVEAK